MYERVLGKRARSEGDDEPMGKKAKGWTFGSVSMLSGLSKIVSVMSEALTSLWCKPAGDDYDAENHAEDGFIECGNRELKEDAHESSEDTDTKYQRILSTSSIERPGPPTVELSVAKPVKLVSRVKLKQQLLDKISTYPNPKKEEFSREKNIDGLASTRGARMLKLVPKTETAKYAMCENITSGSDVRKERVIDCEMPPVHDQDADIDTCGCDHPQEEVSLVDMADCVNGLETEQRSGPLHPVVFSGTSPESPGVCNDETISRAMEVVENLVADLGMPDEPCAGTPRMLFFGDELGNGYSSRPLPELSGVENMCEHSGDFTGFNAVTPLEARCDRNAPNFSPMSFMLPEADGAECMVIENHNADLSPEECNNDEGKGFVEVEQQAAHPGKTIVEDASCQHYRTGTDEPIASAAARQCSLKSAKALLKKRMTLKQAEEDALFTRVREVVVNRHLSERYGQGHVWARLDARGIELNCSIDHALVESEVLTFVRQEKGDDILKGYLSKIEKEWEHISKVRQKYATIESRSTPVRSILKQSFNGQKSTHQSQSLRWAVENIQHRYPAVEMEPEDHHALRRPSSTRGLRMLLASASPNIVVSSPKPSNIDHEGESLTKKQPTNSRCRSRTVGASSGRASQGQRLFQALQQGPCCAEQHAPRTLSMIFDRIDDENECYSNLSNSMTASDNTTSSNSSSRGGIPVGGRWTADEVTCLIQAFKECIQEDASRKYIWKKIMDKYRGRGISECRTSMDIKDKWKNLRRTATKNVKCRYVKLDEETLTWLKSEDANPQASRPYAKYLM